MSSGPETKIVHRIGEALKRRPRCWFFKVHGGAFQAAGIPDLVGCDRGRFFGIEVKTATGKLSSLQALTIRRILDAEGKAGVARSVDEALAILDGE